jgi:hypothetical protein
MGTTFGVWHLPLAGQQQVGKPMASGSPSTPWREGQYGSLMGPQRTGGLYVYANGAGGHSLLYAGGHAYISP